MTFRVTVMTYVPYENYPGGDVPIEDPGVYVHRVVELPFPPFEHLSLEDGNWKCGEIFTIIYHVGQGIFDAHTNDGTEARNTLSFDAAVKALREQGWSHEDPLVAR